LKEPVNYICWNEEDKEVQKALSLWIELRREKDEEGGKGVVIT